MKNKIIILLTVILLINGCVQLEEDKTKSLEETELQNKEEVIKEENYSSELETKPLEWNKEGLRVREAVSSCTIKVDDEYRMYYTREGIGLAISKDGLKFEDKGPILKSKRPEFMITNPAVFRLKDGRYRMLYEGKEDNNRRLYSAISSDGIIWEEEGMRYEDIGDGKPDELFVSVPDVIEINNKLYLYYTRGITLSIAASNDEGITWKKLKDIELENVKVAMDPDIIRINEIYKLFFTTTDTYDLGKAKKSWIASASSPDGINFKLDEDSIITPDSGKNIMCDIDIILLGDGIYRAYYSQASSFFSADFDIYSAISKES